MVKEQEDKKDIVMRSLRSFIGGWLVLQLDALRQRNRYVDGYFVALCWYFEKLTSVADKWNEGEGVREYKWNEVREAQSGLVGTVLFMVLWLVMGGIGVGFLVIGLIVAVMLSLGHLIVNRTVSRRE